MKLWPTLLLLLLFTACTHESGMVGEKRSMYYWRTTLKLSPEERAFMDEHRVERLYVRYFDVVYKAGQGPMPNATLSFEDSLPKGVEVVPVVFITNDCMVNPPSDLADKLLRRILQMSETNDVTGVTEVQVDCDWTQRTRRNYFSFLENLHKICKDKSLTLSTTIRLHQLSQPVPPADRGVLMVYNTGDPTRLEVDKPILDLRDVKPYLRHLASYQLPLSSAYPLFQWRILFRARRYMGILHDDDEMRVWRGDSIAVRVPTMQDITDTQAAIAQERSDVHQEVILYDLSKDNINRFKDKDYETIFQSLSN